MKTTGWYKERQRPVRVGYYEIQSAAFKGMSWMDWWDGKQWLPKKDGKPYKYQNAVWRGLTGKAK